MWLYTDFKSEKTKYNTSYVPGTPETLKLFRWRVRLPKRCLLKNRNRSWRVHFDVRNTTRSHGVILRDTGTSVGEIVGRMDHRIFHRNKSTDVRTNAMVKINGFDNRVRYTCTVEREVKNPNLLNELLVFYSQYLFRRPTPRYVDVFRRTRKLSFRNTNSATKKVNYIIDLVFLISQLIVLHVLYIIDGDYWEILQYKNRYPDSLQRPLGRALRSKSPRVRPKVENIGQMCFAIFSKYSIAESVRYSHRNASVRVTTRESLFTTPWRADVSP